MQPQVEQPAHAPAAAALLQLGNQLMDRGQLAEAIAAYRSLTTLAPHQPRRGARQSWFERGGDRGIRARSGAQAA